jgi:hypothetical protein
MKWCIAILQWRQTRYWVVNTCLWILSFLIYVICVCLGIVLPNTYCVVLLFCLSSSYVRFVCLRLVYALFAVSPDCPFWFHRRYSLTFISIASVTDHVTCTGLRNNIVIWINNCRNDSIMFIYLFKLHMTKCMLEFYSSHCYVTELFSELWQVGGFLVVLWYPRLIKLIAMI